MVVGRETEKVGRAVPRPPVGGRNTMDSEVRGKVTARWGRHALPNAFGPTHPLTSYFDASPLRCSYALMLQLPIQPQFRQFCPQLGQVPLEQPMAATHNPEPRAIAAQTSARRREVKGRFQGHQLAAFREMK